MKRLKGKDVHYKEKKSHWKPPQPDLFTDE